MGHGDALPNRTQASWDQSFVHRSAGADLKLGLVDYGPCRCSAMGLVPQRHQVSVYLFLPGSGATVPLTYHHPCRLLLPASPQPKTHSAFSSTLVKLLESQTNLFHSAGLR